MYRPEVCMCVCRSEVCVCARTKSQVDVQKSGRYVVMGDRPRGHSCCFLLDTDKPHSRLLDLI